MLTDEQVIDALLETGSQGRASRKLGISPAATRIRILVMRCYGVRIPGLNAGGRVSRFTPERVAQLNAYIQQKTQEAKEANPGNL